MILWEYVSVESPCLSYLPFCTVAIHSMMEPSLGDGDKNLDFIAFAFLFLTCLKDCTKRKGGDGFSAVAALEKGFYALFGA